MRLLLVVLFLGAVSAVKAVDPTTVCFPGVFQIPYFNMISGDKGTIHVDFSKELWAEVSSVTGVRSVSDFTKLRSYVLTGQGNDTECQSFKLRQDQIMTRCLPPYATLVAEASGLFHLINYDTPVVQTWDIPTEYDTIYRVVFSVYSGAYWPIMSQQYAYAKYSSQESGYIHHISSEKMLLNTWDIETDTDKVYRVVIGVVGGQPHWPIMSQEYDYHGTTNIYLYLNPQPTVSNQGVFVVPAACQTHDINISPLIG